MFADNLEARRRVIGEEHRETLLSMGNLGLALRNLKRFDEAIDIYLETLEIQERSLGQGHPDTAVSLFNIASLYRDTDRFDLSVDYFERTLSVDEAALGEEHPYVADDLEEYAKLRRKMGMDAEADDISFRFLSPAHRQIHSQCGAGAHDLLRGISTTRVTTTHNDSQRLNTD